MWLRVLLITIVLLAIVLCGLHAIGDDHQDDSATKATLTGLALLVIGVAAKRWWKCSWAPFAVNDVPGEQRERSDHPSRSHGMPPKLSVVLLN